MTRDPNAEYVPLPTTKEGIARHVEDMHPEHVYPKGVALRKWRRDEIASSHAELHNGGGWHSHDESKRDLMAELERSLGALPADPRDLLTEAERSEQTAALKQIHDTLHPCWECQ